jgi:ubiquinone/menaquinone biosynthesis C-methylase UbiE
MFQEESYTKHSEWYNTLFPTEESKKAFFNQYKHADQKTINNWLQNILFSPIQHIIKVPGLSWLTVGDAYGLDAHHILSNGNSQAAHASDLNSSFLQVAKEEGFITSYSAENAEHLNTEDNTFDYVLCKEAYHHFPRPYMAVYEMLRVARKGVVIIEPQDPITKMPLLLFAANILSAFGDRFVSKIWKNRISYEPVGNFIYKVSEREIEKLAAGLNLPFVAFKRINPNFYDSNVANEPAVASNKNFTKIRFKKRVFDTMVKLGICCSQVLGIIIYKETPDDKTLKELEDANFYCVKIPPNPYL